MRERIWSERSGKAFWGQRDLQAEGFIHCSDVEYFWRVAPNFSSITEPMVLVCLDVDKLTAPVKWEDGDGCGRFYPHIYGPVNREAVVQVLPFVRDSWGNFVKNPELGNVENK